MLCANLHLNTNATPLVHMSNRKSYARSENERCIPYVLNKTLHCLSSKTLYLFMLASTMRRLTTAGHLPVNDNDHIASVYTLL